MNKYFFLTNNFKSNPASADPIGYNGLAYELVDLVSKSGSMPYKFKLKKMELKKGELTYSDDLSSINVLWLDYLPNTLAWPFMSKKMKDIISLNFGAEKICWIEVEISSNDDKKIYFIPNFKEKQDVLNISKTLFVGNTDHIIKPCFSRVKIENNGVFRLPNEFDCIPSGLYINESIKDQLQAEKITGVDFEEVTSID